MFSTARILEMYMVNFTNKNKFVFYVSIAFLPVLIENLIHWLLIIFSIIYQSGLGVPRDKCLAKLLLTE